MHRQRGMAVREPFQHVGHLGKPWQHHRVARLVQHERIREVVNVLRSAGEMDELQRALRLAVPAELALQPVLDRLDVVVGLRLDVLDLLRVTLGEAFEKLVEGRDGLAGEWLDLADAPLGGKRLQPGELDAHSIADERLLAEVGTQRIRGPCVSPVERRERGERRGHGTIIRGCLNRFPG